MDQAAAGPDINTLGENVAGQADASNAANLNFGRPGRESALETYKKKDAQKVRVRFKAVGNAPIMKDNVFKIVAANRFQAVILFLRRQLGQRQGDPLFLYINSTFSPAPDDTVLNLYKSFSTEGYLIVNYSIMPAWG